MIADEEGVADTHGRSSQGSAWAAYRFRQGLCVCVFGVKVQHFLSLGDDDLARFLSKL